MAGFLPNANLLRRMAYGQLAEMDRRPRPDDRVEILQRAYQRAMLFAIAGGDQAPRCRECVRQYLRIWRDCTADDAAFRSCFDLTVAGPQGNERAFAVRGLLIDGVHAAVAAGRADLLEQMAARWVEAPSGSVSESPPAWAAEQIEARHWILLRRGRHAESAEEIRACWTEWAEDEWVAESSLIWRALRGVAEGDAGALISTLTELSDQRLARLSAVADARQNLASLLHPSSVLQTVPAALVRLGTARGLFDIVGVRRFIDPDMAMIWEIGVGDSSP